MQVESIAQGGFLASSGKAKLFLDIRGKRLLRIFRNGPEED